MSTQNTAAPILSTLASDPDMAELIQLFVEEIPERVRSLQDFWQRKDIDELRRAAHQLKGSCGGYGFPTLGTAASALEQGLNNVSDAKAAAELNTIASQVDALINLCNRVRAS